MAAPLGQSFAPIGAADEEAKKPNPAQQAIQVLSMRIPRVRGARTISPLIGESRSAAATQVGGFSPESAVLQTLMKTIGAGAEPSLPMGAMPGAASPSMGASNPMAAALAALGAPSMPIAPQAAPSAPSMPSLTPQGGPAPSMPSTPSLPAPSLPPSLPPVERAPSPPSLPGPTLPPPFERPAPPTMPSIPTGPKPAPRITVETPPPMAPFQREPVPLSADDTPGVKGNSGQRWGERDNDPIGGGSTSAPPPMVPPVALPPEGIPPGTQGPSGPESNGSGLDPRMLRALLSMIGGGRA